jgi:SAM-dependent methyltransferase
MLCNVCNSPVGDPIFSSRSDTALTSLCEQRPGRVRVWSCSHCGHLLGDQLPGTEDYYASDYRILLDHDDEDQIYELRDGRIVYRTDHQVDVLLATIDLPPDALLLDYGCAKASTPNRLRASRPDLQVHLFDVSDMYVDHWNRFVPPERTAVHVTPEAWASRFDVVTSFFALEHIPKPLATVEKIAALLKHNGLFYAIVPDTFGNVADFVVIDHVNHFTCPSLQTLLRLAGFTDIRIHSTVHRGALVVVARKGIDASATQSSALTDSLDSVLAESKALAAFWSELDERIRAAESSHGGSECAIYGSGFYGAYIYTTLKDPARVRCFLDQSPFQQGKMLFGKPIISPQSLPADLHLLFVGLNPRIARQTIAQLGWPAERNLSFIFLDGSAP